MDKPAIFEVMMMCPLVWVMYQLVVTGSPAFIFHLLAFAAMVKFLDDDGVAENGTGESHLPIEMTNTDDGSKNDVPSDEIPEVVKQLVSNILDVVVLEAADTDSPTDSGESPLPNGTVPAEVDESDLEDPHPSEEFLEEQPEVQMQLDTVPHVTKLDQEDCETSEEPESPTTANCAVPADEDYRLVTDGQDQRETSVLGGDCNTSDGPNSPAAGDSDAVAMETTIKDGQPMTDAPDGPDCLAIEGSAACPSDDVPLRPLKVDWAVGGIRLRKEPPKLRVDIDVRQPRFIQTTLVSAAEGDDPLPPPAFFYNYRFFYFRHRGNWREMRSKRVHRPTLDAIEEEGGRPKVVVGTDDPAVVVERKAKGAKKRLGRRIRKLFKEWKGRSSCLLPMFG